MSSDEKDSIRFDVRTGNMPLIKAVVASSFAVCACVTSAAWKIVSEIQDARQTKKEVIIIQEALKQDIKPQISTLHDEMTVVKTVLKIK